MSMEDVYYKGIRFCCFHYKTRVEQPAADLSPRLPSGYTPQQPTYEEVKAHIREDGKSRFTSVTRSRRVAERYALPTGHGLILTIRLNTGRVIDPAEIIESKLRGLEQDGDQWEIAQARDLLVILDGDKEMLTTGGIRTAEIAEETRLGTIPQEVCDGLH